MRIPNCLTTLHDQGIITEVLRPLMSGKEAQIYLVTSGAKLCVAKVYKEAQDRSFKHRAAYTEGRKVRNSRDQRAMAKRTKHGREQEEAAWRSTEVDVIYRLHAGGVRVPSPYNFIDGVLVMELIVDADGVPAPRLGDLSFEPAAATAIYERLIREVVRMLCAGVVHGDLSDYNVLLGADGPVIIDFPQSVDTAHNNNARQLLIRDVNNLHDFLEHFVPGARRLPYAEEMWDLHQNNALTPDTQLSGRYRAAQRQANVSNVLGLIRDADQDERKRRDATGRRGGPPAREPPPQVPLKLPQPGQRGFEPRNGGRHPQHAVQPGQPRLYTSAPNRGSENSQHSSPNRAGGNPQRSSPNRTGGNPQHSSPNRASGNPQHSSPNRAGGNPQHSSPNRAGGNTHRSPDRKAQSGVEVIVLRKRSP